MDTLFAGDPAVELRTLLADWYERNRRALPWRETRDPYRIWLSEVMLQQTRVAQGLGYYLRFTERFPDIRSLAEASEDEVLKLWQGLGYYSRARALHTAARKVVEHFGGLFPHNYGDVRALPGVGDYTAAAVCALAYDQPVAVVDGNVHRVLARLYDLTSPADTAAGRRLYAELAERLLDKTHPALHNQAIMEFGALQCTPQTPRCTECPLGGHCLALSHDTVGFRPIKSVRATPRERFFHYLIVHDNGRILLHKRSARDIWHNLYEFPMIESPHPLDFGALTDSGQWQLLLGRAHNVHLRSMRTLVPHKLSHQTIHARFFELEATEITPVDDCFWVAESEVDSYAVPRLIERYLTLRERG